MTNVDKIINFIIERSKEPRISRRYVSYADMKGLTLNHPKNYIGEVKKRITLKEDWRDNIINNGRHKLFALASAVK